MEARLRAVLVTPYTGGNLGDAAIQEAVIASLKQRDPDVEIVLVTLAPEFTARLHQVRGFPIGVTTFGPCFELPGPASAPSQSPVGPPSRLRAVAKRVPLVRAVWHAAREIIHTLLRVTGLIEARHIAKAFRVARGSTIVVISGGGQLDDYWGGPFRQPYALLKWGLVAKAVGARFVFLSVGYCTLRPVSRMLAHAALRLADYRSYRDRKSKDLAAGLPLTHGDPVYPDLAFSYERRAPGNHAGEERRHPVVGISPIAYMSRYGWPDRDSGVYNNYVRSLVDLIAELAGRDCAIVLFSSDAADLPVVGELMERLAERPDGDLSTRVTRRSTLTLDELIPEVDACDYVVASRLHGVILSHLRGRPTLAISYDRKVDTHMRDMGMPEYCLDIHKLESTSLIAAMTTLMANGASVQARLRAAAASRADALQQQYDRVWSAIGAGQRA